MIENYYEPFFIQNWVSRPDGFGGTGQFWDDGREILGTYIQNSSNEVRVAEAQGMASIGVFATGVAENVRDGDVVRRARDGAYFKITGIPMRAPEQAVSQFKKMNAERIEVK